MAAVTELAKPAVLPELTEPGSPSKAARLFAMLPILERASEDTIIGFKEGQAIYAALHGVDDAKEAATAVATAAARNSFADLLAQRAPVEHKCDCKKRFGFSSCLGCMSFKKPVCCQLCLNSVNWDTPNWNTPNWNRAIRDIPREGLSMKEDYWGCKICLDHRVLECCPSCNGLGVSRLQKHWDRCICHTPFIECDGRCASRLADPRAANAVAYWVPKPGAVCTVCEGCGWFPNSEKYMGYRSPATDSNRQRLAVYKERSMLIYASFIRSLCKLIMELVIHDNERSECFSSVWSAARLLFVALGETESIRKNDGTAVAAASAAGFDVESDITISLKATYSELYSFAKKKPWINSRTVIHLVSLVLPPLKRIIPTLSPVVGRPARSSDSAAGFRACGIDIEDGASCLARTRSGFTLRLTEYAHLLRRVSPALHTCYVLNGRRGPQDFASLCDLIYQLKELTIWKE